MSTIRSIKNSQNTIFVSVLVTVLILAAYLRLDGISWDQGFSYSPHPDERAILMKVAEIDFPNDNIQSLLNKDSSSWNPRWFAYGTFPIYLLNTVQSVIDPIAFEKPSNPRTAGRILSALADIGTVCGVALLGRRFFSPSVGLLASVFTAFAVIHIQLAHFFTFDTFVTFFSVWTLFFLYKVATSGNKKASIISGSLIGLGIASKFSVFVLIAPFLAAHLIFILRETNDSSLIKPILRDTIYSGLIGISAGLVIFVVAQPYALLDWTTFWSHINEQSEMVRRLRDYPYTRQYIDTAAYAYQTIQMGRWGLGWPLTIFSVLSIFWALGKGRKFLSILVTTTFIVVIPALILLLFDSYLSLLIASAISVTALISSRLFNISDHTNITLLLSWIVPYLLITGSFEVKFIRYLLPALPVLFVMCAALLTTQITKSNRFKSSMWTAILIITVITTVIYGLSTRTIYSNTHTAVSSAEWINKIEPNSVKILKEHWEESLPNLQKHSVSELPIYDPDGPVKIKNMSESLERADYIVIYSNRMYGTVTRLPERYPLMISYYNSLFSGDLGYELVNVEASYMSVFGVSFIEDTFDRPGIINPLAKNSVIQKKQGLDVGFADESFSVYDHPKVLLFKNEARLTSDIIQQTIYKNSRNENLPNIASQKEITRSNLRMSDELKEKQQAGGTWSEIIDKGSLGTKYPVLAWLLILELLSLIVLPAVFLLFNSFTYKGYLFSKIIGILAVCFLTWSASSLEILEFNKTTIWLAIAITASLNMVLFFYNRKNLISLIRTRWKSFITLELLFLVLFGLFVLIRAMNPDLWHPYRGGEKPMDIAYLNAVLKSTYMPPYDPWFAGGYLNYYYWGQFIVASFIHLSGVTTEIAYNLAVATFFALTGSAAISIGINLASSKVHTKHWLKILAGVSSILFILIIGNMNGFYQILHLLDTFLSQGFWGEFDFWQSSRMMPPDPPGFEITEFPFFTFLFADLHAHLMAIPFGLLVIGVSMALVMSSDRNSSYWLHWSQLTLLGITIGAIRATNTWDVPIYAIIAIASILIFHHRSNGGLNILVFKDTLTKTIFVAIVALVTFLPYHLSSQTFFNSLELTTNLTTFSQTISINGLFIFVNLSGLVILAKPNLKMPLLSLKNLNVGRLVRAKLSVLEICCYLIVVILAIAVINLMLKGVLGGAIPVGILGLTLGAIALYKSLKTRRIRLITRPSPFLFH